MSDGMNIVILAGNTCADSDLRFTQGGQAVLALRVATNETYFDKDRVKQERTDFHNVIVWGKRAEGLAKILRKGDRIVVQGSLRTSSYDDKDGNKRYKTEVIAKEVILGGKGGNAAPSDGHHDAPAARSTPSRGAAPRQAPAASSGYDAAPVPDYGGGPDEDLPF